MIERLRPLPLFFAIVDGQANSRPAPLPQRLARILAMRQRELIHFARTLVLHLGNKTGEIS
jgi:hypothetical protein